MREGVGGGGRGVRRFEGIAACEIGLEGGITRGRGGKGYGLCLVETR